MPTQENQGNHRSVRVSLAGGSEKEPARKRDAAGAAERVLTRSPRIVVGMRLPGPVPERVDPLRMADRRELPQLRHGFGQHPSPRNASVDLLGCEMFERVWVAATGSHEVTGSMGTVEVVVECDGASAPKLTRLSSIVV